MTMTKDMILDGAEVLFLERGFNCIRLKDIADISGIKKTALYSHFNGKEDIYIKMIFRTLERIELELNRLVNENMNRSIMVSLKQIGDWAISHPLNLEVMLQVDLPQLTSSEAKQIPSMISKALFKPLKRLFDNAIDRGEIRDLNSVILSGVIGSLIDGLNSVVEVQPLIDHHEVWHESIDILLHGMKVPNVNKK